ncbi:MAG: hypothetical protein MK193_06795 [Lentisphaeria bacterium]|nr:hypothetical protein [Lentisphaeria bacterium]
MSNSKPWLSLIVSVALLACIVAIYLNKKEQNTPPSNLYPLKITGTLNGLIIVDEVNQNKDLKLTKGTMTFVFENQGSQAMHLCFPLVKLAVHSSPNSISWIDFKSMPKELTTDKIVKINSREKWQIEIPWSGFVDIKSPPPYMELVFSTPKSLSPDECYVGSLYTKIITRSLTKEK